VLAAALAAGGVAALAQIPVASAASIGQLGSQLGQQQSRQQSLSSNVAGLSGLISSLDGQIGVAQSREAVVRADLAQEEAALATTRASLRRERRLLIVLHHRLVRSRMLLSRQLVSSYENDSPDLVAVVLNAHGFTDLLEKLRFLRDAEHQQQSIIKLTRRAKAQADAATRRLTGLEASEREITASTATQVRAIEGMQSLLQSKQAALQQARAVQQEALSASRDRSAQLRSEIGRLQAQQAAPEPPVRSAPSGGRGQSVPSTPSSAPAAPTPTPASAGGSATGPWAIPSPIVQCESGGQNLGPNQAGASGYYQIIPSTWKQFGGTGPAAYMASKAQQSAVASRIYNGGSGVSAWDCAAMVGIH
jgi:peptidoglycan hydrolase CwlO-like protein